MTSESTVTTRLVNTHDQLKAAVAAGLEKRRAIAISYHAPDRSNSRDVSVARWSVWSPFMETDADAAWYDYGHKTFALGFDGATHKGRKANALAKAMRWANERYVITEWAKNRQGDYVPKEINDNFPLPKRER